MNATERDAYRNGGTSVIAFTVYGRPRPQGSKSAFVVKGRAVMREASEHVKDWRQQIASVAIETMDGKAPLTQAVKLVVVYHFQRPKSHYGTGKNANQVKASAPLEHTQKPDLSKLVRALEDALTGIVFKDDSQVASLNCGKQWSLRDFTEVEVYAKPEA